MLEKEEEMRYKDVLIATHEKKAEQATDQLKNLQELVRGDA